MKRQLVTPHLVPRGKERNDYDVLLRVDVCDGPGNQSQPGRVSRDRRLSRGSDINVLGDGPRTRRPPGGFWVIVGYVGSRSKMKGFLVPRSQRSEGEYGNPSGAGVPTGVGSETEPWRLEREASLRRP